ncbi:uncharacterized protein [Watersipora subatra]|uniref:uncharacterized protein n=1 Tax=Watersipora subatra TaxID=2589382 RepID=UPI00355C69A3
MAKHYKVLIVGAGMSGCTAARALLQGGIEDILILEATDRIGGRVKTISIGSSGRKIDLGAQWIHGIDNPLYEELNSAGLLDFKEEYLVWGENVADRHHCHDIQGARIDKKVFVKGLKMSEMLDEAIWDEYEPKMNMAKFKKHHFKRLSAKLKLTSEEKKICKKLLVWVEKTDKTEEATEKWDRSEKLYDDDQYDIGGNGDFIFKDGAYSIFQELFLPVITAKVKLETEVTMIDYSSDDAVVRLTTNSGEIFTADHVIITPALSYLKQNHQKLFHPPLPASKSLAIEQIWIGVVEKFIFFYEHPFWTKEIERNPQFSGYGLLMDGDDETLLKPEMQKVLGDEVDWWKYVANINTVQANPNILSVELSNDSAREAAKCSDDQVVEVLQILLRHYTGQSPPHPSAVVRSNWGEDKYFLGSYSSELYKHYSPQQSVIMLEPIYNRESKPILLFAGEAFHRKWMSTLHGAYDTGLQQANAILGYIKNRRMTHKVAIVGAGIAGCAAAKTLIDNGIEDIIILEATERIGGRVKTVRAEKGGHPIDLGARWLHGQDGNPLYGMLEEKGLLIDKGETLYKGDGMVADTYQFLTLGGQEVDKSLVIKALQVSSDLDTRIRAYWKPGMDIDEFRDVQLSAICKDLNISNEESVVCKNIIDLMDKINERSEGIPRWTRTEHIYATAFQYDNKDFSFTEGAFSVFDHFLLPTIREKIKLNAQVTKVSRLNDSHGVSVETNTGTVYTVEHVIITASLGFLKAKHTQIFDFPLGLEKEAAIENIWIGVVEKFILYYDVSVWTNELQDAFGLQRSLSFLMDESDANILSEEMEDILGKKTSWWKKLTGLDTDVPNALGFCLSDRAALEANKCSDDQIIRVALTLLRRFTGITTPLPTRFIRTNWSGNKFFQGSYISDLMPKHKPEFLKQMLEPIYWNDKPVIMFAGEAYHEKWMSTIHGAYDTGVQQAMVISDYLNSQQLYIH